MDVNLGAIRRQISEGESETLELKKSTGQLKRAGETLRVSQWQGRTRHNRCHGRGEGCGTGGFRRYAA
jgi:hypothetical protein